MARGAPARQNTTVLVLLFALLGSLVVALRIVQREEIWIDRTWWLVAIAAFGGFFGATGTRAILASRDWRLARYAPKLTSAALFACLFMGGMMLGYVIQYLVIADQFEPNPERLLRSAFFSTLQVAALFLISSPTYLLPWPLPALMAAAAWLLAPEPAKPVEPAGDGV